MSCPHTVTPPELGGMKPVIMRMVVDLPAPFGPRKPSTSPLPTSKETPSTASFAPKDLLRFSTLIIRKQISSRRLSQLRVGRKRPASGRLTFRYTPRYDA